MQPIGIRENDCCFTSVTIWVENKQIKLFHIHIGYIYIYIYTHIHIVCILYILYIQIIYIL